MKKRPVILELVGPAGAGKTTLRNALSKSSETFQIGAIPNVRDVRNFPFFLWDMGSLLPVFFAFYRDKKQESLTLQLMIKMAILSRWARQLKTLSLTNRRVVILDQGPVYILAELLRHGTPNFRNIASTWLERAYNDWANVLDMVICLDTSDAVLMERIHARERRHIIKRNCDQWAVQFLAHSRTAQSEVLDSMAKKYGGMKVIQIDTSHTSMSESVQQILAVLD